VQPRPIALQVDWHTILQELTSFGLIEMRVGNPAVALSCLAEPWSAHLAAGAGMVNGPGISLAVVTPLLASASIENGTGGAPADHVLRWFDWSGQEALGIALTEESNWSSFHALLVRQWAQRAAPRAVLDGFGPGLAGLLERLPPRPGGPAWERIWHRPGQTGEQDRLQEGVRVDPTLLAPFLEAMADQALPLRILVGNTALLQCHESDFYDCAVTAGSLRLRGSTATLAFQLDALAAACVISVDSGRAQRKALVLSDDAGRVVATLLAANTEDGEGQVDPLLWRTLVSALTDRD
jgi:putative heme degradation protein